MSGWARSHRGAKNSRDMSANQIHAGRSRRTSGGDSQSASVSCTTAPATPIHASSRSVTRPRGTGRYGRKRESSAKSLNSSAMRSCRKNNSDVTKATTNAAGRGTPPGPRSSDEKHTADALKAATSGA